VTYDPNVHTLEYVLTDLDKRMSRVENALRELVSEPDAAWAREAAQQALERE